MMHIIMIILIPTLTSMITHCIGFLDMITLGSFGITIIIHGGGDGMITVMEIMDHTAQVVDMSR